jgi:hypothetical protein
VAALTGSVEGSRASGRQPPATKATKSRQCLVSGSSWGAEDAGPKDSSQLI